MSVELYSHGQTKFPLYNVDLIALLVPCFHYYAKLVPYFQI